MSLQNIKNAIRNIPDFPQKGIQFKDITPILKDASLFNETLNLIAEHFKNEKIDYIAGIEARGFIIGAPLANLLHCGFIPIRKKGKLPYQTLSQEYNLEYGTDRIEMHKDALQKGDKVLLIDDLLATSGTTQAAIELIKQAQATLVGTAFMIELTALHGRKKLETTTPVFSLLQY